MSRKPERPAATPPRVTPQQAVQLLRQQIQKGQALLQARPLDSNQYETWKILTNNYLEKSFGSDSPNVSSVANVGKWGSFPMEADEVWWEQHRIESLQTQLAKLEGLIELLQTEADLMSGGIVEQQAVAQHGLRIFIVHGHDDKALHEMARFLDKLEQKFIILREEPNQGKTIIEKFESYANVGFAIVLLTPDDRGGPASATYENQRPRARQNVILELGYFLGRLGRNRVCVLYRGNVEIPSDYSGVIYVELDDRGAWRLEVAKELKAAQLPVDMNKM